MNLLLCINDVLFHAINFAAAHKHQSLRLNVRSYKHIHAHSTRNQAALSATQVAYVYTLCIFHEKHFLNKILYIFNSPAEPQ
jgi:hypothetical protein